MPKAGENRLFTERLQALSLLTRPNVK